MDFTRLSGSASRRHGAGFVVALTALLLLSACGSKGDTSKDQTLSNASTDVAKTASERPMEAASSTKSDDMAKQIMSGIGAMTDPNAKKKWQIEIDGANLPKLSGGSVMVMNMPGLMTHYTFIGGPQMTTLDIQDVKDGKAGTYKPTHLQILYTSKKLGCGASARDPNSDVTIKLEPKGDGVRGTLEGTVVCRDIGGGNEASKPQTATLHGWFEK